MVSSITERQKELLENLYRYIISTGYPPTFEELREQLNVSSNQSVIDLLAKLEKKKLIKRNESQARSITILPLGYEVLGKPPIAPFLGATSAGVPLQAIEISGEWQILSSQVAMLQDNVFLLQISGDSMINAGIDDGDKVLVKSQKEFVSGDVVLANVGDARIKFGTTSYLMIFGLEINLIILVMDHIVLLSLIKMIIHMQSIHLLELEKHYLMQLGMNLAGIIKLSQNHQITALD